MQRKFYYALPFYLLIVFSCSQPSVNDKHIQHVNHWYHVQGLHSYSNKDSILRYALLIDSLAKDLPDVYKAMALVSKARYNAVGKPELAQNQYEHAIALLKGSGADSIMARAYNGIGVRHMKKADYPLALEYYFKALKLFEQLNDSKSIAGVLANIGELYQVKNDISNAKTYILQSMNVSKKNNNIESYLDAAHTLANIYGMNNQFDSAMAIDRIGLAAADSMGSTRFKSAFFNNLGNCYLYSNRPDSARYYFTQCVALDSSGGMLNYMVDNYLTLGQLSLQQKELSSAEFMFKRAIQLADSIQEKQLKMQAWKALGNLYLKQNNLSMAITAKDSAAALKDRIINEKSENKIAELRELYETDKKEQTIALQQVKLSRQRIMLIGSGVLLALLIFSGWLYYRRYKLKKEKEMQAQLMQQREKAILDILNAENQERQRIAAELHDGVGQVMLAAWMNLQAMQPHIQSLDADQQVALTRAIDMVGEGCREVREVSHTMMPNAIINKGLIGAVRKFVKQIDQKVLAINFHTEDSSNDIDPITSSILYRVIQECVNNAIKHAKGTELDISLQNNEEGISIQIEDNGIGFSATGIAGLKNNGLGIQNIKSRIAFLNGTVEWDSTAGNGTVVTIFIPSKNS